MIRHATESDVSELVAISFETNDTHWNEQDFRDSLCNGQTILLVAEEENQILGFAILVYAADQADLPLIAVRKTKRHRGIGKLLLDTLCENGMARGVRFIFLEVRESNRVARHLYEAKGFEILTIRKAFYRAPVEDALLMRYDVNGYIG